MSGKRREARRPRLKAESSEDVVTCETASLARLTWSSDFKGLFRSWIGALVFVVPRFTRKRAKRRTIYPSDPCEVMRQRQRIITALNQGNCTLLLEEVKQEVDYEIFGSGGWSILMYAVRDRNLQLVKGLLNAGADPNHSSIDGWTPLLEAVDRGEEKIVRVLLLFHANPNLESMSSLLSPLKIAGEKNDIPVAKLLLSFGASVRDETCLIAQKKDKKATASACRELSTPLMWAAYFGSHEIVKLLLRNGASTSAVNTFGESAHALASKRRNQNCVYWLEEAEKCWTPSRSGVFSRSFDRILLQLQLIQLRHQTTLCPFRFPEDVWCIIIEYLRRDYFL